MIEKYMAFKFYSEIFSLVLLGLWVLFWVFVIIINNRKDKK